MYLLSFHEFWQFSVPTDNFPKVATKCYKLRHLKHWYHTIGERNNITWWALHGCTTQISLKNYRDNWRSPKLFQWLFTTIHRIQRLSSTTFDYHQGSPNDTKPKDYQTQQQRVIGWSRLACVVIFNTISWSPAHLFKTFLVFKTHKKIRMVSRS